MIDNALDFEGLKYYDDKNKTYIKEQITIEKDRATAEESKKANIASPTFTGTPKAPTATAGTNTTQIATTAFVQTALTNLGVYNLAHDFHTMVATDSSLTTWNKLFVYVWNTYFVAKNKAYETVTSWIVNETSDSRHTAVAAELSTVYSNLTGSGFNYATVIFERVPSRACMSVIVYPLVASKCCMKCTIASSNGGFESKTDNTGFANSGWYIDSYTHPTYTARTGKPTANQTPAFGGTATVSQITSDATGHVTGATDRTITIPSTLSNGTSTAGLIKTTSTVTSNSGYTACPVISGVPYYKDTNTTYTLSSFGITATSTELNYCDGVTSNIQTQLGNKLNSSSVTTSLASTSTTTALAASAGKNLQDQITSLNSDLNPNEFLPITKNYSNQHWTSSVTKQGNVAYVQGSCYLDDALGVGEYNIGTLPYKPLFAGNFSISLMDSSDSIVAGKYEENGNVIIIVNSATLNSNINFCMNFHYVTE